VKPVIRKVCTSFVWGCQRVQYLIYLEDKDKDIATSDYEMHAVILFLAVKKSI